MMKNRNELEYNIDNLNLGGVVKTLMLLILSMTVVAYAGETDVAYILFNEGENKRDPNVKEAVVEVQGERKGLIDVRYWKRLNNGNGIFANNTTVDFRVDESRLIHPVEEASIQLHGQSFKIKPGKIIKGKNGEFFIVRHVFPNGKLQIENIKQILLKQQDVSDWKPDVKSGGKLQVVDHSFVKAMEIDGECIEQYCLEDMLHPEGDRLEAYQQCVKGKYPSCPDYCEKRKATRVVYLFTDKTLLHSMGFHQAHVNLESNKNFYQAPKLRSLCPLLELNNQIQQDSVH